jgi:hypothetical protein
MEGRHPWLGFSPPGRPRQMTQVVGVDSRSQFDILVVSSISCFETEYGSPNPVSTILFLIDSK